MLWHFFTAKNQRYHLPFCSSFAIILFDKHKICHRDLKSPNILMADKSDPEIVSPLSSFSLYLFLNNLTNGKLCKISDFGESRLVATSGQGRQNLANPLWLAPEVMRGGEYTEKCDVYRYNCKKWSSSINFFWLVLESLCGNYSPAQIHLMSSPWPRLDLCQCLRMPS